jgi:hypothetical protein
VAIAEAMEEQAERRGGRLDLPALFALDELANVVRWASLPDQFSHYGSKGLIVVAILQSWSQGMELQNLVGGEHQGLRRRSGRRRLPPRTL